MISVAITFDDGRSDNWLIAKPIMEKYDLCGTVYVTTGYIDGTWDDFEILTSPSRPLTKNEIIELEKAGWEIGLHGDKHRTQVDDMRIAYQKLKDWGVKEPGFGISLPDSLADEKEISRIMNSEYGDDILYIRRGRRCDTSRLLIRIYYVLYTLVRSKTAYRKFNFQNSFLGNEIDKTFIPSIVIKSNDRPNLIIDYLLRVPDGSVVVFMLHSVLEKNHPQNGKDPWSMSASDFETLCQKLFELAKDKRIRVQTLRQIVSTNLDGEYEQDKE